MQALLHTSLSEHAQLNPDRPALLYKDQEVSYKELDQEVTTTAQAFLQLGIKGGQRVGIYLPKQLQTVFGMYGAVACGASFVPINPLLKPKQVAYILANCNVKALVTSSQRAMLLQEVLGECKDLETLIVVEDETPPLEKELGLNTIGWSQFRSLEKTYLPNHRIDADMAAILYTSGSTGNPKGVVLSHRNMVAGADAVAAYLENNKTDRILAVLPLSFDAGLSQITTAFSVGAAVVLMDYLLPRDVIRAVVKYNISGLAAVPPLWNQLISLEWPPETATSLRYITNTGGAMPVATTQALRKALPQTSIFLMYGLTEAFRSTYLPPDQVDIRPESIGKAIPNAEILVVNDEGNECKEGEPGELVHRGALVSMGYWNDLEKTAERFKPSPGQSPEITVTELAVWSGDQVVKDEEGYLYFISRKDDMIKTSGYRVSPTEVEEVVFASGLVSQAAALGQKHATLGQAILVVAAAAPTHANTEDLEQRILDHCRSELPNFMIPQKLILKESLPKNQNGKIDRRLLSTEFETVFQAGNT